MSESAIHPGADLRPTLSERLLLGMTPRAYVRSLMTPWDAARRPDSRSSGFPASSCGSSSASAR